MVDNDALRGVVERIDGYRDEVIRVQTELCKRPALGPESDGDGEREKADWLKGYLEGIGLEVEELDSPDDRVPCGHRPNLIAMIDGAVDSPKLWIMTHTDVVPPGDLSLWSGDPWTLRIEGDRLIARGVEDNQSGLVSSLLMAKAFKEAGVRPRIPVGLVFVADEETGSKHGLQYLLDNHGELFSKEDLIIVPDSGDPKGLALEVAEKSILWIKIRTLGKQCHGSEPEKGINAHKAAAYLTTRLETLYHRFRKRDKLFAPPISTFEPTKKEANVPNVNTIPGEDVVYFDCRVLPQYKLGDVVKAVKTLVAETRKKYKVKVELDFPQYEAAAPPTDAQAPVARAITLAMKQLRRRTPKPLGIGGGTVAKFFRQAGFPCVVWCTMDERAHTPDEYIEIPYILDDAKVFAHVALQEHQG
jgi:succinyl-diaminopimelate desuccinylase